jgi:hypothetical protein
VYFGLTAERRAVDVRGMPLGWYFRGFRPIKPREQSNERGAGGRRDPRGCPAATGRTCSGSAAQSSALEGKARGDAGLCAHAQEGATPWFPRMVWMAKARASASPSRKA